MQKRRSAVGYRYSQKKPHLMRGVLAGVVGGLAASWVMNQFFVGLTQATEAIQKQRGDQHNQEQKEEDSTMKVADALASTATGRHLTQEEKETGGPIVHYAFGGLMGGVYGGLAEYSAASRFGFGTVFGSTLFAGADGVVVPALGLSKPVTEQPLSNHASHWAAHIIYGAIVELVRRGIRQIW
jgi:putative membrane protein